MNNHRPRVEMPRFDVTSDEQLSKIKPASYAVHIIQTKEEKTVKVLPPHEHEVEQDKTQ